MFDMLIGNANLPEGSQGIDIVIKDGKIIEVAPLIKIQAIKEIEAKGCLVSPPFVDSHFQMDATLSLGQPRLNESGTLLEGIELGSELKPHLTVELIKQPALELYRRLSSHIDAFNG
jgi:cytosine deaminase